MVNRYRPAGDGIMRPVPAKSHLCATYVDAHAYAALEARCRELEAALRRYGRHLETCADWNLPCSCGLSEMLYLCGLSEARKP